MPGINTDKFYTIHEAKTALKSAPTPEYGTRGHNIYFYEWDRVLPEQNTMAFERPQIMEKLESLIRDAVQKKIKPQYCGMWLGVVFEDYMLPVSEKTTQNYTAVCDCIMETYRGQLGKIYTKVFFLGTTGNHIKHYD
jgi:hypothetical protein